MLGKYKLVDMSSFGAFEKALDEALGEGYDSVRTVAPPDANGFACLELAKASEIEASGQGRVIKPTDFKEFMDKANGESSSSSNDSELDNIIDSLKSLEAALKKTIH